MTTNNPVLDIHSTLLKMDHSQLKLLSDIIGAKPIQTKICIDRERGLTYGQIAKSEGKSPELIFHYAKRCPSYKEKKAGIEIPPSNETT